MTLQFTSLPPALTAPIDDERPWVVFGACRDVKGNTFFPMTREESQRALAICSTCPVQLECLEYALEARERYGIWGGKTEKQRRQLLRKIA
jgi:WhiB family redox-sensing transcriptional regulator